jgi:hypothetical protein
MKQFGSNTKFNATLRKMRADGKIVYSDNKLWNFILKLYHERKVR